MRLSEQLISGWSLFWTIALLFFAVLAVMGDHYDAALILICIASFSYWGSIAARMITVTQLPHASLIPNYARKTKEAVRHLLIISVLPALFFIPHPLYVLACLGVILSIMLISFWSLKSALINFFGAILLLTMVITDNEHNWLVIYLAVIGACLVLVSPWLPKRLSESTADGEKLKLLRADKNPSVWYKDYRAASSSEHVEKPGREKRINVDKDSRQTLSAHHLIDNLFTNRHANWQLFLLYPLLLAGGTSLAIKYQWINAESNKFMLIFILILVALGEFWLPLYRQLNQRKTLLTQLRLLPIFQQQNRLRTLIFLYIMRQQGKITLAFAIFFFSCFLLTDWSWETWTLLFSSFLLCSLIAQLIMLYVLHNNEFGETGFQVLTYIGSFFIIIPVTTNALSPNSAIIIFVSAAFLLAIMALASLFLKYKKTDPVWYPKH